MSIHKYVFLSPDYNNNFLTVLQAFVPHSIFPHFHVAISQSWFYILFRLLLHNKLSQTWWSKTTILFCPQFFRSELGKSFFEHSLWFTCHQLKKLVPRESTFKLASSEVGVQKENRITAREGKPEVKSKLLQNDTYIIMLLM